MDKDKQRIAIAEACGFTRCYDENDRGLIGLNGGAWENVPDYLNDLNAMHEAENVLARDCKEHDYWFFLRQILSFTDAESDWDEISYFAAVHATAAQRAEAFLRTFGKWEGAQ